MPSHKRIDKKELEARVRQLLAIDTSARDVYADLAKNVEEEGLRNRLVEITRDEGRHIALFQDVLALLTGDACSKT